MTNKERQKSLENKKDFKCGNEVYCKFCNKEEETPCAKAYNRMKRNSSNDRERYSWGDF